MSYAEWRDDASHVSSLLPPESSVSERINYLNDEVAPRGQVYSVSSLDDLPHIERPGFAVIDMYDLDVSRVDPELAEVIYGSAAAFVSHTPRLSIMGLGWHNPKTPLLNGMILIHELEHITENEVSDTDTLESVSDVEQLGIDERRAYATNAAILKAVDGEAFDDYVASFKLGIKNGKLKGDWKTSLFGRSRPPKDTLMRDLLSESKRGKMMLDVTAIATSLDNIEVDPSIINQVYGRLHVT